MQIEKTIVRVSDMQCTYRCEGCHHLKKINLSQSLEVHGQQVDYENEGWECTLVEGSYPYGTCEQLVKYADDTLPEDFNVEFELV